VSLQMVKYRLHADGGHPQHSLPNSGTNTRITKSPEYREKMVLGCYPRRN